MKIKLISYKPYPEFSISESDKLQMHIKLDINANAFRIKYKDSRRVFFIYEETVKNKSVTTLLNEYSQQLGSIATNELSPDSGQLEIEGESYIYRLNNSSQEIKIFKNDPFQSTLVCSASLSDWPSPSHFSINYIMFSIGWFIYMGKEKEVALQLA